MYYIKIQTKELHTNTKDNTNYECDALNNLVGVTSLMLSSYV